MNPANPLVPFGKLENLHFARFVILDDQTLDDIRLYGLPRQEYPVYLAFLCDFDGGLAEFLTDLVRRAGARFTADIFFLRGFHGRRRAAGMDAGSHLPVATSYVNWRGRTVKQVREEARCGRQSARMSPPTPRLERRVRRADSRAICANS